nr:AAA family ATPase [Lentisphaeria bacterium]
MVEYNRNSFSEVFEVKNGSLWKAYDQLELNMNAGRPLIYIQSFDFAVVDAIVAKVARQCPLEKQIIEFVSGLGVVTFEKKETWKTYEKYKTLKSFLEYFAEQAGRWSGLDNDKILLLKNVRKDLENYDVHSLLRQISLISAQEHGGHENHRIFIIVATSELFIPPSLERLMALVKLEPPNKEEIKKHVMEALGKVNPPVQFSEEACDRIIPPLLGLNMVEIDQVLSQFLADNKRLESHEAHDAILDEKRQLIQKSGLLKLVDIESEELEVGGLESLKDYLDKDARVYNQLELAKYYHVEIPKGVLIVGMPGCGKTLSAKLAAKKFKAPLICLDIGRLMGQYVGQSEENMRRALDMVESVAPCVLWIDELEKAFSGVSSKGGRGGSEVSTRLFGYFLTWMQEKRAGVYVIATANRISQLPPELLRRGRFDEIFRVNFPKPEEVQKIFQVHLKRYSKENFKIPKIPKDKEFCGADIAAIVGRALKKAFLEKKDLEKIDINSRASVKKINAQEMKLNKDIIEKELKDQVESMIPLKDTLKDDIREIELTLNKYDFLDASSGKSEKTKVELTVDDVQQEIDKIK